VQSNIDHILLSILIVIFELRRYVIHSVKTMRHEGCSSWVLNFVYHLLCIPTP